MARFGLTTSVLAIIAAGVALSPADAQDAPAVTPPPAPPSAAATATDQAGVADIVVTATRMGETRLQSTPIAVTALTGQQITDRGIRDVFDLKNYAPSLQVSDLSGYTQLYIRGIGSNIVFIGSDPSTTIHSDGIYLARPLSYLSDFLDVDRIEVLRGPQGTLYGRNSVGGTINVISRKPSEELTGEVQALYGTYNRYGVAGYVSGPIAGGVLASLATDISGHDAFRKNISTGNDLEDLSSRGVRAQVLVPVGSGEWIVRGDWSRQSGALGVYPKLLLPGPTPTDTQALNDFNHVSMDQDNHTTLENYGVASDLTLPLADGLKLHSLTGYRWFDGSIIADADSSAAPILLDQIRPIRQHQFSQELTLLGDMGRFHWVAGAYYFYEHDKEPLTLTIIPAGITHVQRPLLKARSLAGFAQGEYKVTETISLIAGLRYTGEHKSYQLSDYYTASIDPDPSVAAAAPIAPFTVPFAVDAHRNDHALTPKFGINWKPNDRVLVYASATRGFKSGGFDYGSTNAADAAAGYGPEKLWSYEIGLKSDLLARRLRFNLTGFYYDYTDLQVENFVQNISTGSFGAVTQNAATAHVKGVEVELVGKPVTGLELSANLAYLDARYSSYPSAFVGPFDTFDASGNRLNNAPKWAATLSAAYRYDLHGRGALNIGVDSHIQSRVFFTAANGAPYPVTPTETISYPEQQKAYGIVNGRIGWTSPSTHWKVQVIGTNLFDKDYILGTANFGLGNISARQGRPREVFGQVSYSF